MEELIVKKAGKLFFAFGLKSIRVDDIAKESGISKKTIYQFVADKSELIQQVVNVLLDCNKSKLLTDATMATNAVEEVALQLKSTFTPVAHINCNFFYDLEKYYPSVWQTIIDHKDTVAVPTIIKNINRGIHETLYRADVDIPFTAFVRVQQYATALTHNILQERKTDPYKLLHQLTDFYLQAITTEKGKKLIAKYMNN